ncbi:MAG TPA: PQQ-binding-like beta-propeller repeat protein [Humisphaera sp.]|jgi:outer membrane protein assembly factor BamB|nr:PQQ-binding-like beta-propeller repeat protein [Humisphaera sp.]
MTPAGKAQGLATQKLRSIIRAAALRALVYTILLLIVIFSLVDFSSLSLHATVAAPKSQDVSNSGPGWPHFRGVGYDGHSSETELAESWPAKGPPILWNREIGAGYSGITTHGGRAFAQAQGLTEQKVFALDADTGQTIWEHGHGWPYQAGGMFPGPRATPTWHAGRIYFAAPHGLVGCLDAGDGHSIWSVNVVDHFGGRGADFGYACSPVVEGGKVILPVGGPAACVVALDAKTGATIWASGTAAASYSSALPITFHGRRQVVVLLQTALAGFDLQTGRLLWEQTYPRGFEEHSAALLYDEPYLRMMQAYRAGSELYMLEAGAADEIIDGVPVSRIKKVRHDAQMSNDVASSVLVNGFVYGFDLREMQASGGRPSRGTFRCIDFKTGEVRWSSDRPGQASIVVADGKLLMLNDSGQVLLVRADPNRYEEIGRADIFAGETCWTAPALDGGRLYLRSPTRAACLFVGKPQRMTPRQQALASTLTAAPKPAPRASLTWLVGAEREYPFEMPEFRELARWYLCSLGAMAAAGLLAAVTGAVWKFSYRPRPQHESDKPNNASSPSPGTPGEGWEGGCVEGPSPARTAPTLTLPRSTGGRDQTAVHAAHPSRSIANFVFFSAVIVFGVITTPLVNARWSQFVFTWPLALIAVHQIALMAVTWSRHRRQTKHADLVGIIGASLLVLCCVFYFKLTRQLNLAPAWYFLVLLPAAWPLAVPLARRLCRPGKLTSDILWMFAIFTIYFWAAGGVMIVRTTLLSRALSQ